MQRSGFFNAVLDNGVYDRKYNANDYCDNLAVVIGNGVLRGQNDDLKVTADGLIATVAAGRAWINGRWYINDNPYVFAAASVPAGGARYDRVLLRLNTDVSERSIELVYREGTAANTPEKPAPVREGAIYELVLADIYIAANATSMTVTDTRADKDICGWVYSVVGNEDFFASLDNLFNEWFNEKKNTLASTTLFKKYSSRVVLDEATNTVNFNISQYDAETCFIEVYVNGLYVSPDVDYTLSDSTITFNNPLIATTEIEINVYKSIDGAGIMSVADEITALQNAVASMNAANNYFYNCNGVDDNVKISEIAQDFLNGGTDNAELTITVVGNFGATAPVSGDGSSSSPYSWFNIGKNAASNRRVKLDFSGCNSVNLTQGNKYYYLFNGIQYTVKNLCLNIDGVSSYAYGQPIFFGSKNVYFENCRITANVGEGWLFSYGTFRDCEITIKTASDKAAVFRPMLSSDVMRIYGGEYRAYTSLSSGISAVIYCAADISSAVIIADGLSCPTKAESGFKQSYSVYDLATSNYHRYLNLITELTLYASAQTVRDTIVANK